MWCSRWRIVRDLRLLLWSTSNLSWKARTCGASLVFPNGKYRSMSHPCLYHDAPHLHTFDDKTVHRFSVVQTCTTSLISPNGKYAEYVPSGDISRCTISNTLWQQMKAKIGRCAYLRKTMTVSASALTVSYLSAYRIPEKLTLRLSRGQSQTCLNYAEAEQWRVAIGEPTANSQKPTVNIQRLLSKNFRKPLNIQKTLRTFAPLL